MTRARMLREMDSRELSEWMAFFGIEPFEGERFDVGVGLMRMTTASSGFGGAGDAKFEDFLPRWGKEPEPERKPEPQTVESQKQVFALAAKVVGWKD